MRQCRNVDAPLKLINCNCRHGSRFWVVRVDYGVHMFSFVMSLDLKQGPERPANGFFLWHSPDTHNIANTKNYTNW